MRIKKAIKNYNSNLKRGEKKITQLVLSKYVLPEKSQSNAKFLINRWSNGHYEVLKVKHLLRLSECLKVDIDYLIKDIDINNYNSLDVTFTSFLTVVNKTGRSANEILNQLKKKK